jgi:hypothetical protein
VEERRVKKALKTCYLVLETYRNKGNADKILEKAAERAKF